MTLEPKVHCAPLELQGPESWRPISAVRDGSGAKKTYTFTYIFISCLGSAFSYKEIYFFLVQTAKAVAFSENIAFGFGGFWSL